MKLISEIQKTITNEIPKELKKKECKDIGNQEIWKDVVGYEGSYRVSNLGRVKSIDRVIKNRVYIGKIKIETDNRGYKMVRLSKNSKGSGKLVHRLVALAFIENKNNYPDVNHKDLDKTNNRLENLEWVSEKQNIQHAIKNGAMNFIFGQNNFRSIFTKKQVENIRLEYWNTNLSTSELALKYFVSKSCIITIINNSNWYDSDYKLFLSKNKRLWRNTGCKNGASKLTEKQVIEIRELKESGEKISSLSKKFKISIKAVYKIIKRITWRHI